MADDCCNRDKADVDTVPLDANLDGELRNLEMNSERRMASRILSTLAMPET